MTHPNVAYLYSEVTTCRLCGEWSRYTLLPGPNIEGKFSLFVMCPNQCSQNVQQRSNFVVKDTDLSIIRMMLKQMNASAIDTRFKPRQVLEYTYFTPFTNEGDKNDNTNKS